MPVALHLMKVTAPAVTSISPTVRSLEPVSLLPRVRSCVEVIMSIIWSEEVAVMVVPASALLIRRSTRPPSITTLPPLMVRVSMWTPWPITSVLLAVVAVMDL